MSLKSFSANGKAIPFHSLFYRRFRYTAYLKALNEWLKTRAGTSLNVHQLKSLIKIFKKMTKDFELQGVLNVRDEPYGNIAVRNILRDQEFD